MWERDKSQTVELVCVLEEDNVRWVVMGEHGAPGRFEYDSDSD